MKKFLFFDVECFPNYFMVGVLKDDRYEVFTSATLFEKFINTHKQDYIFVGYNCATYDNVMIAYWLKYKSASYKELKELSDTLIEHDNSIAADSLFYVKLEEFCYLFKDKETVGDRYKIYLTDMMYDCFDLIMWGKSEFNSLKNCQLLLNIPYRKLPFAPDSVLTEQNKKTVAEYCGNDLNATKAVFDFYKRSGDVDVRLRYMNLFPRAGMWKQARLAEDFFVYIYNHLFEHRDDYKELKRRENPEKHVKRFPVSKIIKDTYSYHDKHIRTAYKTLLNAEIVINSKFTPEINSKDTISFTDRQYNKFIFGVGGLHNEANSGVWKETNEFQIINVDATSFWPFIVSTLKLGTPLYPEYHKIMSILLNERVRYKAAGDKTANVLKLAINSVNGKTGERFSSLYSQRLSCGFKMHGELMLLKLWDMLLTAAGYTYIELINANTDGLFFACEKGFNYTAVFEQWTKLFNIPLEYENYHMVAQASVNDYFALCHNGKLKTKGGLFQVDINSLDIKFAKAIASKKLAIYYLQYDCFPSNPDYPLNEYVVTVSATKDSKYIIYPFKESGTVALIADVDGVKVYKERWNEKKDKVDHSDLMEQFNFKEYKHGADYNIDMKFYESEARKIINSVTGGKK